MKIYTRKYYNGRGVGQFIEKIEFCCRKISRKFEQGEIKIQINGFKYHNLEGIMDFCPHCGEPTIVNVEGIKK